MKVAFIFDTVLLKKNEDYYGITLTYDFFERRYLSVFNQVVVISRVKDYFNETGNVSGYKKTNGINVNVKPICAYNDIPDSITKRNEIIKQLSEIIDNCDAVIIRMPSVLGIFAAKIARKKKKKYMIEMVACPFDGYMNHARFGGKLLAPIMYFITRNVVKKADMVLYVTENFLQHRYPNKKNSISCSDVVLKDLDDSIEQKKLDSIRNLNKNEKLIISTVASVGLKYKGQEYVMRAISKSKYKNKIIYNLAGGGDNSRLKIFAKKYGVEENVKFLGSLSHNEVFDLLDTTDLYIQPSLQEGLPRALIEAMSRGCVCFGFKTGGIPELLSPSMICNKRDYFSITKMIDNIDIEKMCIESKINFAKAKEYNDTSLFKKRSEFYKKLGD